jgi:hypothetical protein
MMQAFAIVGAILVALLALLAVTLDATNDPWDVVPPD